MNERYKPPVQSKTMQFVDIAFILAAIFVTLWLPLELGLAALRKKSRLSRTRPGSRCSRRRAR